MDNHVTRGWNDPEIEHRASVHLRAFEEQLEGFPERNEIHADLFQDRERWPKRPYCSDDKTCSRIRQLDSAKRYQYMQLNPHWGRAWLAFDVDRPQAAFAAEDAGLPPPTWCAVNRATGHAHVVYGLAVPVLMVAAAQIKYKPIRFLSVIEASFREKLKADGGYAGILTKNPLHPRWRILRGPRAGYELGDLEEYVPDGFVMPKPRAVADLNGMSGLQRNVALFDALRYWAYQEIRGFDHKTFDWGSSVIEHAHALNATFTGGNGPLGCHEVDGVGRSVAKWVLTRNPESYVKFSNKQRWRGSKGGLASGAARRARSEPDRAKALEMVALGHSTRQIATVIGVNQSTVHRWARGDA